jgi:hypothetical protein
VYGHGTSLRQWRAVSPLGPDLVHTGPFSQFLASYPLSRASSEPYRAASSQWRTTPSWAWLEPQGYNWCSPPQGFPNRLRFPSIWRPLWMFLSRCLNWLRPFPACWIQSNRPDLLPYSPGESRLLAHWMVSHHAPRSLPAGYVRDLVPGLWRSDGHPAPVPYPCRFCVAASPHATSR